MQIAHIFLCPPSLHQVCKAQWKAVGMRTILRCKYHQNTTCGETQTSRPSLFLTETLKGEAAFPHYPPPSGLTPCVAASATSASSPPSSSCSQHLRFALIFRQIHCGVPWGSGGGFLTWAEAGGEKQGGEGGLVRRL